MKERNQYTEDVERFVLEHGYHPFVRYKEKSCTEEEKKYLEDWLFSVIRKKNVVPVNEMPEEKEYKYIKALSELDSHSIYSYFPEVEKYGYKYNTVAINFLYHFFPEMMDVKKKDQKSMNEFILDDSCMRRAVKKALTFTRNELLLRGAMALCRAGWCPNFRPSTSKAIYELWGTDKDCKVLDTSSGYGARLLGAHFAKNVVEYVGVDPNTANSNNKLSKYLNENYDTGTKEIVYEIGSEDFKVNEYSQYKNYFDLYFTSPPYFNTEMYSDAETQSYKRFPTYGKWIKGFYRMTIYNACDMLKKDGIFMINIFEKIPNIKEITKMFLADKGWYVFQTDIYELMTMPGMTGGKKRKKTDLTYEPIFMAKHYTRLLKEGLIDDETANKYKSRAMMELVM